METHICSLLELAFSPPFLVAKSIFITRSYAELSQAANRHDSLLRSDALTQTVQTRPAPLAYSKHGDPIDDDIMKKKKLTS